MCCAVLLRPCSVCRHVPPPDPLPDNEPGFVPQLAKGTLTGKRNPPGFPTLKTMSVSRQGCLCFLIGSDGERWELWWFVVLHWGFAVL
jgi:hypothetical protein